MSMKRISSKVVEAKTIRLVKGVSTSFLIKKIKNLDS